MRCWKPAHPPRVGPGSYRRPMSYPRYADAFGVDRGSAGCWRYVYADASGPGRPGRCPGRVRWAGIYRTPERSWRVFACDDHPDGGVGWIDRAGIPI